MKQPKLACCNFILEPDRLFDFAMEHGFEGVEWSLTPQDLPENGTQEIALKKTIDRMRPLEVRYHAAFKHNDPGHADPVQADRAFNLFEKTCRLVADLGGRHLTIHSGLGLDSTHELVWDKTAASLKKLNLIARGLGVRLCLENLAWGWSSRPNLFEKLVRETDMFVTLDLGHAQVSPAILNLDYDIEDFVEPHPDRVLGAHVYHLEKGDSHLPPESPEDLTNRLNLLSRLPNCGWWLLELREEKALLKTLEAARYFVGQKFGGQQRDFSHFLMERS